MYNPQREAESIIAKVHGQNSDTGVFLGIGLGYSVVQYSKTYPNDNLVVIECNPSVFFTAMLYLDWTHVFKIPKCVIALNAPHDSIIHLIEQFTLFNHCSIVSNPVHQLHSENYYKDLESLIKRNIQKENINSSTLQKFSKLWLRNSCKNLNKLASLDGVKRFYGKAPEDLSAVILAAGPTLQEVLPHLGEIKKRAVIIAVDTALRACLNAGVEPDFIILVDPQYYAARHIMGLTSQSSILITESSVYPCVFRFNCKETVMCSSMLPIGQYFEAKLGYKGVLQAGGSVSTTAWDFAHNAGFREIIFAGLDLGYPDYETHIKGSTFEEKIHTSSNRLNTAESANIKALFSSPSVKGKDYEGNSILTDSKMKMFAWWFESKALTYMDVKTKTFSAKSLYIPGLKVQSLSQFLQRPEQISNREAFLLVPKTTDTDLNQTKYDEIKHELMAGFDDLYKLASRGIKTVNEAQKNLNDNLTLFLQKLNDIDSQIMTSSLKEATSLVFPTESELNKLFDDLPQQQNQTFLMLQKSKIIYTEIKKSIKQYNYFLFNI